MRVIKASSIKNAPVSHGDVSNPAASKKVLLDRSYGIVGHMQMINWATLLPGREIMAHTHKDMYEIYVMIAGRGHMKVDDKDIDLERSDALIIEPGELHQMINHGKEPIEFIAMGVVR